MDCSIIVITDQYYENNCYHVTMASEGKGLMISCLLVRESALIVYLLLLGS